MRSATSPPAAVAPRTRPPRPAGPPSGRPSRPRPPCLGNRSELPVLKLSPAEAMGRLAGMAHPVWLDSAGPPAQDPALGRWSFVSAAPRWILEARAGPDGTPAALVSMRRPGGER